MKLERSDEGVNQSGREHRFGDDVEPEDAGAR